MKKFVHLHTHTSYSLLDGAAKPLELIGAVADAGQPAIASTDHGNLYAVPEMVKRCAKAGVQYIPGMEAYQARESILDRPKPRRHGGGTEGDTGKLYHHLTLLAATEQGYRNLIRLSSEAFLKGYYYKPRVDWEMLEQYNDGLIATTSCLGGVVLQEMMLNGYDAALLAAQRYKEIFGDRLYVEVQNHGLPEQLKTNVQLVQLAKDLDLQLVATNDLHYVKPEDHKPHEILLCCQTHSTIDNPNRFKFASDEHYLRTPAEMYRLFSDPMFRGACENTLEIASRCEYTPTLKSDTFHLPSFPFDTDLFDSNLDFLRQLVEAGARRKFGHITSDVATRINYEIDIIASMGFIDYFLITWDIIKFATEQNILTGYARGSAGGSLVAYCLDIIKVNPLEYGLIFERFLNPSRISMPDIDMDIDTRYREKLIRYVELKYGSDNVTQIITIGRLKARQSVRDTTKAMGLPYTLGSEISSKIPQLLMGRDTPLWAALAPQPPKEFKSTWPLGAELRAMYAANTEVQRVCDTAVALEGLAKSTGVHAAGVVLADKPITEYLPVQVVSDGDGKSRQKVKTTQWDLSVIEDLGLLKMDFLGLRNLDIVSSTLDALKEKGIILDLETLPLDDAKTYTLLQRGMGNGVFQVESRQMQTLMTAIHPETIDDIAAIISLYRPGPMAQGMDKEYANRKNGKAEPTYFHEDARGALQSTHGVLIYQEQMMELARTFAGYSLAEADTLRKATGKKDKELMHRMKNEFISRCQNNGYSLKTGEELWALIEPFADYSFNKSHAVGYGLLTYATAYLKANYPAEYMTALLTSVQNKIERAGLYIAEARRLGLKILPPDINQSLPNFATDGSENIYFALGAISRVGAETAAQICAERSLNGSYQSFNDFVSRNASSVVQAGVVEALISSGAFDSLHPRKGLLAKFKDILGIARSSKKRSANGVVSIFGSEFSELDAISIPNIHFDTDESIRLERAYTGCFLSKHPLDEFVDESKRMSTLSVEDVLHLQDTETKTFQVLGIVTNLQEKVTKKGLKMAVFEIEDLSGIIEAVVFPAQYKTLFLENDQALLFRCRLTRQGSGEINKVMVMSVATPQKRVVMRDSDQRQSIVLSPPNTVENYSSEKFNELKEVIQAHPGSVEVLFRLSGGETVALGRDYTVDYSPEFVSKVRTMYNTRKVFMPT